MVDVPADTLVACYPKFSSNTKLLSWFQPRFHPGFFICDVPSIGNAARNGLCFVRYELRTPRFSYLHIKPACTKSCKLSDEFVVVWVSVWRLPNHKLARVRICSHVGLQSVVERGANPLTSSE